MQVFNAQMEYSFNTKHSKSNQRRLNQTRFHIVSECQNKKKKQKNGRVRDLVSVPISVVRNIASNSIPKYKHRHVKSWEFYWFHYCSITYSYSYAISKVLKCCTQFSYCYNRIILRRTKWNKVLSRSTHIVLI